ncbi:MAG: ATP-binding protein [Ruminococcus sp.]|nr:ATP-binding protein [Candidatus Copronaster equi]
MGKIIAVYGSPGSGKTSLSLMLARELYLKASDKGKVIFLSSDLNVPSIGLIFPNYKPDEIGTLSAVLDSTDISENNLLKNSVTIKSLNNFCCLGFKSGDNRYSFPVPTQNKLNSMFDILSEMS